jgi:zona occludens toxin (predicted ATPase)
VLVFQFLVASSSIFNQRQFISVLVLVFLVFSYVRYKKGQISLVGLTLGFT